MNQKGFAPILIIFLIALGVGGYLVYSGKINLNKTQTPATNSPSPTPQVTSSSIPDETANWKTYEDDKYGVEFKYPPNWYVIRSPEFFFRVYVLDREPTQTFERDIAGQVATTDIPAIDIVLPETISDSGRKLAFWTIEDELNSAKFAFNNLKWQKTELTVNGKKALQVSGEWGPNEDSSFASWLTSTYVQLDDHMFVISSNKQARKQYNQILSTFKFTE